MFLAAALIVLLLIVALWLCSRVNKLKLNHRFLHIRPVLVTMLFAVLTVLFFSNILQLLNKVLTIPSVRDFLFGIMPQKNISAGFFWVVSLLSCLALALAYLIITTIVYRLWLKPLSKKEYLESNNPVEKLFNRISFVFYTEKGKLKMTSLHIGRWFKYFRCVFGILVALLTIAVSIYLNLDLAVFNEDSFAKVVKSLYIIPVLSYFILEQIEIYLMGDINSREKDSQVEDVSMVETGDLSKLLNEYKALFGGEALITAYKYTYKMEKSLFSGSGNAKEAVTSVERCIQNAVKPLQPHFCEAVKDLTEGKSVAVCDSFSGEFLIYYLGYVQSSIYKGRTALIICDTQKQVDEVVEQYKKLFLRINKIHTMWNICSNESPDCKDADVLVCTEEALFSDKLLDKYPKFFNRLHDIAVLDTYGILCRNNAFVIRFFNYLNERGVQFAFFIPENNVDIKNALKKRFGAIEINIYENFSVNDSTDILCWRSESVYKTQSVISKQMFDDFGVAYTIAVIAGGYDISNINIYASDEVPLDTYSVILHNYEREIETSSIHRDYIVFNSLIKHNEIRPYEKRKISFDIYYDTYNNLLNVARIALASCGSTASMIHIVSKPYMLRDYFAARVGEFNDGQSGVQFLVPAYFADSVKAACVALLIKLRESGMRCEEILKYAIDNGIGDYSNTVEDVLKTALVSVFESQEYTNVYDYFGFGDRDKAIFENGSYKYCRPIVLANKDVYKLACSQVFDYIRIEGDCTDILPKEKELVYNYYLPKQIHCFNGKRYVINRIHDGVINVTSEETVEYEPAYTNNYEFENIDLNCRTENYINSENYSCDLMTGTVERNAIGYFTHIDGLNFNEFENREKNTTLYTALSEPINEKKKVTALKLRLIFPFGDRYEKAAALFVVLFRGVLETLLPLNYKEIITLSKIREDSFDDIEFYEALDDISNLRKDPIPSDWIEGDDYYIAPSRQIINFFNPEIIKSNLEENSPDEIILYFINFANKDNGVLETVANNIDRIISILQSYVEWYVQNPKQRHNYLNFGYKSIPEVFDRVSVNDYLEAVVARPKDSSERKGGIKTTKEVEGDKICSFCGRPASVISWDFPDGRVMCQDCHKFIITKKGEAEEVLKKAKDTIKTNYVVDLPKGISTKFMSADQIKKEYGRPTGGGRILGLDLPAKKTIWVESGGPQPCVMSTLIHELTHAWQDSKGLLNLSGDNLYILEGQAMYVEIECMRKLGHTVYADYLEKRTIQADDEIYAKGLLYWKEKMKTSAEKNIFRVMERL